MYSIAAKNIIKQLNDSGYIAFMVGGCVRDILLNKIPNDYDICTNATPDEIKDVFKNYKTVDVGKKFGTIGVVINDIYYEVTTFRKEEGYVDHRKPTKVEFVDELFEDLSRRDFTINAMAYNDKIYDYFNGFEDLQKGIIRTVGNPRVRFDEDGLRILRCFRFASTLGFSIEISTEEAAIKYFNNVLCASWQRRAIELKKMISGFKFDAILIKYGKYFFELLEIFKYNDYYDYIEENQDFIIRLLLMYYNRSDILDDDLNKMELNKKFILKIHDIYKCFKYIDFSKELNIRKKISFLVNDIEGVDEILHYAVKLKKSLNMIDDIQYNIFCENIKLSLSGVYLTNHIIVKGSDLIEWGYLKENIKGILNEVLYKIINGNLKNDYNEIKNYVINNF